MLAWSQEEQVEALAQLSAVMQFGWSVNRALRFEVFIHKVDCLQDDQKLEVQREIHRRVLDQCLQSFEPDRIAQLNNLIRCACASAASDLPATTCALLFPLLHSTPLPSASFGPLSFLPPRSPDSTNPNPCESLLSFAFHKHSHASRYATLIIYTSTVYQMCLLYLVYHVNTNHMICNVVKCNNCKVYRSL